MQHRRKPEAPEFADRASDDVVKLRDYFIYRSGESGLRSRCAHVFPICAEIAKSGRPDEQPQSSKEAQWVQP
jgi:hypothetical protein